MQETEYLVQNNVIDIQFKNIQQTTEPRSAKKGREKSKVKIVQAIERACCL